MSHAQQHTAFEENQSLSAVPSSTRVKLLTYRKEVIVPFAHWLQRKDPDCQVLTSGSFQRNPENLRSYSDLDVICLSPGLFTHPPAYIQGLVKFNELARAHRKKTKTAASFFTSARNEVTAIEITRLANPDLTIEEITPVHFLFYRDLQGMMEREPDGLVQRLISNAQIIVGKKPDLEHKEEQNKVPSREERLVRNIRWDIERSIADFVLNLSFIPGDVATNIFSANMNIPLRFLGDILEKIGSGGTDDVQVVLKTLDPDQYLNLSEGYRTVQALRKEAPSQGIDLNEQNQKLATLGSTILQALDRYADQL